VIFFIFRSNKSLLFRTAFLGPFLKSTRCKNWLTYSFENQRRAANSLAYMKKSFPLSFLSFVPLPVFTDAV
jgi:hypothetical protein